MNALTRCTSFLRAHVFPWECVFDHARNVIAENDPSDPGGVTKYGIDQRAHPGLDIRALTEAQAISVYYGEFVRAQAAALPVPLGELLFDILINGGPGVNWLQTALGVTADGFIGPRTLAAAQAAAGDASHCSDVIAEVCVERDDRFKKLAEQPHFVKFLSGWLNRSHALLKLCLASIGKESVEVPQP